MTMHRPLSAALGLALLLAACGGAAPAAPPSSTSAPSGPVLAEPTPVPVPSASDGAGSGGGGSDPGQGGGIIPVDPGDPGAGGGDDDDIPATPVDPVPGAVGVHDAAATGLRVSVNGRRVAAELRWWSGVEPCYVLAGVDVVRDGSTFTLTIHEGSAAGPDVACIDLAMLKSTIVDLGELEPGRYTIRAFGDAAPVEVVVAD
jgi:hypothetical protein